MRGTIAIHKASGDLIINGDTATQKGVILRKNDIEKHNLKEGDRVIYGCRPYETAFIIKKEKSNKESRELLQDTDPIPGSIRII